MRTSNSIKLVRRIREVLEESGMNVSLVKEPDINEDSLVEHEVFLDVVYNEVIFNVQIVSILFAGHIDKET